MGAAEYQRLPVRFGTSTPDLLYRKRMIERAREEIERIVAQAAAVVAYMADLEDIAEELAQIDSALGEASIESHAEATTMTTENAAQRKQIDKARETIDPPAQGPLDEGDEREPKHVVAEPLKPITE